MSQFQLLPYQRISDYFGDQLDLPLSTSSLFNFNKEAYRGLVEFEEIAKHNLRRAELLHADETGINVNGKRIWLHCASNQEWTYLFPHQKRGTEAMNEIDILPHFAGILCHDHWKSYYKYDCTHSLCNAHHLRELENAKENFGQKWAGEMQDLLKKINIDTHESGEVLSVQKQLEYQKLYREILENAEIESPPPLREPGKRGRTKKSKPRNLLERLKSFEDDTLRFMTLDYVPFTNNVSENDIRMSKVQQKISGCFRSIEGAKMFCAIRSYISTCQKNNLKPATAINMLLNGSLPDFIQRAE